MRWRTENEETGRVRYGTSLGALDQTLDELSATTEHELRITGLDPAMRYYYSIGSTARTLVGDARHWFETAPLTSVGAGAEPLRFWILGDSGTADEDAYRVKTAYQHRGLEADVMLLLGDNAYPDGTDEEYQDAFFDVYPEVLRNLPVFSTIGNHDLLSADSNEESGPYYEIFSLPRQGESGGVPSHSEAYYSFDYGNVHFVCLDSQGSDRDLDGPMMTWLQDDLSVTTADWVVAFFHHPPYTKGSHDSDESGRSIDAREEILPVLEDYGVDLVLSGHSHSYERSMLLDRHYGDSGSLSASMTLDTGDGDPLGSGPYRKPTAGATPHEGAVFVVAGSSGKVSTSYPLDHPAMAVGLAELGSVLLEVQGNTLDAHFLDDLGQVRDRFRIEKAGGSILFGDGFEGGSTIRWSSARRSAP